MKHREDVENYPGTLQELASDLGNLRYDALAIFLRALATKLETDSRADADRGRAMLAAALNESAEGITDAAGGVERAWVISAPHM